MENGHFGTKFRLLTDKIPKSKCKYQNGSLTVDYDTRHFFLAEGGGVHVLAIRISNSGGKSSLESK